MYYTTNERNEINGFYGDDYPSLPANAIQCTEELRDCAMKYQTQGLALCVTDGVLTGEQRPNSYSYWSAGRWVEDTALKAQLQTASIIRDISDIDAQIVDIEASQLRPLREIALGLDADGTASGKLTASAAQIASLRAKRTVLTSQI